MKFVGKTLNEYYTTSKKSLANGLIIMALITVLRLSNNYPPRIQSILSLLGVIVIGWAGWTAVTNHRFNLKQTGFLGLLFLFTVIWTLPIFHNIWEMPFLILTNAILYVFIATFGGWLAQNLKK
jgi:uncharacterized membrane protein YjgN (DUF898 family)